MFTVHTLHIQCSNITVHNHAVYTVDNLTLYTVHNLTLHTVHNLTLHTVHNHMALIMAVVLFMWWNLYSFLLMILSGHNDQNTTKVTAIIN